MEQSLETDPRLTSGEWCGFFVESHRSERGWMHLFMTFVDGQIKSEGTDYVGPWHFEGTYDLNSGKCQWIKKYRGLHNVYYDGTVGEDGIKGTWEIKGFSTGPFHIWPKHLQMLNEMYWNQERFIPAEQPSPVPSFAPEDQETLLA